jgi:hypothetical protein
MYGNNAAAAVDPYRRGSLTAADDIDWVVTYYYIDINIINIILLLLYIIKIHNSITGPFALTCAKGKSTRTLVNSCRNGTICSMLLAIVDAMGAGYKREDLVAACSALSLQGGNNAMNSFMQWLRP